MKHVGMLFAADGPPQRATTCPKTNSIVLSCGAMKTSGSHSMKPAFKAGQINFQQTNIALLTKLAQESNDVKYVHSYMHIYVFQFRTNFCELFEAAYRCAQKLAESQLNDWQI